jgi:hypothetical protein
MVNPFDVMNQFGHPFFQEQAPRFGLSQQDIMRATAALMPAFMYGLRQQAPTSHDWLNLFQPDRLRSTDPMQLFFGIQPPVNPIAEQAAMISGINSKILQDLIPVMAETLANGLGQAAFTAMAGGKPPVDQSRKAAEDGGTAWGSMMAQMMGFAPEEEPEPEPEPDVPPDPVEQSVDAFAQMLATSREAQEQHIHTMQSIITKMMGGA